MDSGEEEVKTRKGKRSKNERGEKRFINLFNSYRHDLFYNFGRLYAQIIRYSFIKKYHVLLYPNILSQTLTETFLVKMFGKTQ